MRIGIIIAIVLGLLLAAPQATWAADDHHKSEKKDGHSDSGEKKNAGAEFAERTGLTRWDLGIWSLVVFGLLFAILGKFAWGPMIKGLDAREAGLKKIHDDAATARDEAQKALAEVQARLAKANDEVRAMLDEARRDAQATKDRMKVEAVADIQAEKERARREIETAKDGALQEIYKQAVELASLVSSKAVKRELTPADHARLIDEALAEMKQNLSKA